MEILIENVSGAEFKNKNCYTLLGVIAVRVNDDRLVSSYRNLSELSGLSIQSVRTALKRLQLAGVLTVDNTTINTKSNTPTNTVSRQEKLENQHANQHKTNTDTNNPQVSKLCPPSFPPPFPTPQSTPLLSPHECVDKRILEKNTKKEFSSSKHPGGGLICRPNGFEINSELGACNSQNDDWFREAWEFYVGGKTGSKQKAKKCFKKLVRTREDWEQFKTIHGLYREQCEAENTPAQYIQRAETFFRNWNTYDAEGFVFRIHNAEKTKKTAEMSLEDVKNAIRGA